MKQEWKSILIALSTFTILPVPSFQWEDEPFRRVPRQLPLVGLVVGLLWGGVAFLLDHSFLHPALQGVVLAFFPWVLTGFLHLDGLMDVADAMLSWREREERLRILKDPCCGPFGVASFGLTALVTFAAGWAAAEKTIPWLALTAIPVLSRGMAALGMELLPSLSASGFKAGMAPVTDRLTVLAAALWTGAAVLLLVGAGGLRGGVTALLQGGVFWWICSRCRRTLGGVNGDVLGCAIVLCETGGLLVLAV